MNTSISSLESRITLHNSFIADLRSLTAGAGLPKVTEMIEDITREHLLTDSMKTNFVINHEKFFHFHQELLGFALENNGLSDPDFERAYKFFLKIYLVKSNFRFAAQIYKRIFRFLGNALETDRCSPAVFSSILSVLHLLSGYNGFLANSKYLMFSGAESSGLTLTIDLEKDFMRPFLNKEFSYVICFTTDFSSNPSGEEPAYLIQLVGENADEEFYSIFYKNDRLWFESRTNNPSLQFPIFENAYSILSKKWNTLLFSSEYDPKSKISTLTFRLNDLVYKKSLGLEVSYPRTSKQRLVVFNGISGYLSTLAMWNKCVTDKEYKALSVPSLNQGAATSEALELFLKIFEDDLQKSALQFLLTPMFAEPGLSRREAVIMDFVHRKLVSLNDDCFVVDNNPNDFSFNIISRKTQNTIFALFNYIEKSDDFKVLLKIVINFLSQDRIVDCLQGKLRQKIYRTFLGALISSGSFSHFDVEQVELLVNTLHSQNSKYRKRFLNKFLLNFHLFLHILHNEETTKAFFNAVYKLINSDFNLLCEVDVQSLMQSQLIFLHRDTPFDNLKALLIGKIVVKIMNENHYTGNLDITGYLLYLNAPKESQTQILFYLLNTVAIHLKNCNFKVENKDFFVSCLANFIVVVDYSLYIERALKLLFKLDSDCEKLLIFVWRGKVAKEACLEPTRRIFLRYIKSGYCVQSSLGLTTLLVKRVFENLNKHNVFASEKIALKKKAMLNLLFDISILLEPLNIEKVLQCLLVSFKKNPRDFVALMKRSNFLIWVVSLMFMFHNSTSNEALFDLANKLLVQFCAIYAESENNVVFLSHLSELVQFFSAELNNSDLRFTIITNIFREFDSRDLIMSNDEMLNSFVIYTFHYFYTNLRADSSNSLYLDFLVSLTSYVHKTVNLNPSSSLAVSMQKELTNSFTPRLTASFAFWGLNSSSMKNMRIIRDSPLKYLTIMMLACFSDLNKLASDEASGVNYRFINGYFDKLLHFLENNRVRLKPEKAFAIEVSLYHILKEVFREAKAKNYIKEIKESLFYFSDISVYPNSFAAKFLKALGVQGELLIDRFFAAIAAVHTTKSINIEDYEDFDYNLSNEGYALKALGEINQALEENNIALVDLFFSENDIEKISNIKSSMYVQNTAAYKTMIDALHVQKLKHLQQMFNNFYKLYKHERGIYGNLFDEKVKLRNFVEDFELRNFEYEPSTECNLKFKHNPVILNNLQKPFLKKKPVFRWKKPNFPNLFAFPVDANLQNYFFFKKQEYFVCEMIHQLTFIPCFVSLKTTPTKARLEVLINFQHSSLNKSSLIELKKFKFKRHKKLMLKISLAEIKEIKPYKFLQRRSALMLITRDQSQIIFNFHSADAASKVESAISAFQKAKNYKRIGSKQANESKFSHSKWLRNDLSNFKYLMKVNINASRSLSDFSQYPIFPLLIKSFGKSMNLRELHHPIGMIGEEKRAKVFLTRFKSSDNFSDHPNYHYGSHYSSPATVFNFLIRLHPYAKGCKAIQSGHFDLPDRLFFSLKFMLKNIMEEMSDVRELIPEFYYLPEFLLNVNNFDFGINQQSTRVHNVILPDKFGNSPYRMVYMFRQLLESQEVSSELGGWIDLIFGCKQNGQEAVEARNVFFHLTYEENVKQALALSDSNHHAIHTQIYHFGQTPVQLFDKPHPSKKTAREPTISSLEVPMKYFIKMREQVSKKKMPIIFMKEITTLGFTESVNTRKVLLLKEDSIEIWKLNLLTTNINQKNPFDFFLAEEYSTSKILRHLTLAGHNPKYMHVVEIFGKSRIIFGGVNSGSLMVFNYSSGKFLIKHSFHTSTVIHLALEQKYNRLLSADISGLIVISALDSETQNFLPQSYIYDYYNSPILSIGFNSSIRNLFYIRTRSGIDLRSLQTTDKNLTSVRLTGKPEHKQVIQTINGFKDVLVSFGYVNCFVVFLYHQRKNHLFSISFEGQIIGRYVLEEESEPMFHKFFLVPDEYHKDHVAVCNKKGDLIILDLPFFEQGRRINSNVNINVCSALLINKNKSLLVADDRGVIDIFSVINS